MAVESINKKPRSVSGALFFCHPQTFFYYCHVRPFSLQSCSGLTQTSKLRRHAECVTRTSNRKRHAERVTRTSPLQIPRSNRGMTRESKSQQ